MEYRLMGDSGLMVSKYCLGTMSFGMAGAIGAVNQDDANAIVGLALEREINFFDTSDIYSNGLSEEILGKALGSKRSDVVIATKVFGRTHKDPNGMGLSRSHMTRALEASLKRLKTDYIDLYYLHSYDEIVPLEETLSTLDEFIRQGKVRYIGCSNFPAWMIMKALAWSDQALKARFVSFQGFYSYLCRDIENEHIPLCHDQGVGVVAWSPLAGGLVTGKYMARQTDPRAPGVQRKRTCSRFGRTRQLKLWAL